MSYFPRQLLVDDHDPSLNYFSSTSGTNDWMSAGASKEFMNTTSYAFSAGAGVSLTFSGSLIAVFGTISAANQDGNSEPTTQYFLDSEPPITYHAQAGQDNQYRVQFYQSRPLSGGPHTLRIVIQSQGHFWLDYMVITGNYSISPAESNPTTVGQSTQTTSSTSVQLPASTSSRLSASTPSPSNASSSDAPKESHSPAATIASEVLGATLGFVLVLLLAWYIRRRLFRKRSDQLKSIPTQTSPHPKSPSQSSNPQPMQFPLPTPFGGTSQAQYCSDSASTRSLEYASSTGTGNIGNIGGSDHAGRPVPLAPV